MSFPFTRGRTTQRLIILSSRIWLRPEYLGWALLSYHLEKRFAVRLQVRQCQNLFHRLGFSLQRPRRQVAKADPEKQEIFKKNSKNR
ncbi:hypothetical protein CEE34_05035 [Candidatus Aerophobetes bacterium Ae_b3a]|nr:MAG: hypothetical protein CEE34_05035 [Candidatus Aerophobetes bacterium Ae_b3a]